MLLLFLFSSRSQKEDALHFRVTKSNEVGEIEKVHYQIILSWCRYRKELRRMKWNQWICQVTCQSTISGAGSGDWRTREAEKWARRQT